MQGSAIDMLGNKVRYNFPPVRIISVVPSQTELLYDLGLEAEVLGITKFCVHPEAWFRSKTRVGGTKTLHIDKIRELSPDLIIGNKEENVREEIEILQKEFPVWISDIKTVADGLEMIRLVGSLVDRMQAASKIADEILKGFSSLQRDSLSQKVAYFIWYRPWMSVGYDTFIHSILEQIGWQNVFKDRSRYPEVSLEELTGSDPDLVLLSSEPFPFKERHIQEIKQMIPRAQVLLVDGEMFSWYGSRMIKAIPYLSSLLKTT